MEKFGNFTHTLTVNDVAGDQFMIDTLDAVSKHTVSVPLDLEQTEKLIKVLQSRADAMRKVSETAQEIQGVKDAALIVMTSRDASDPEADWEEVFPVSEVATKLPGMVGILDHSEFVKMTFIIDTVEVTYRRIEIGS